MWGPVVLYMAVIFYVSSLPNPPIPRGLTDKSSHSLAYALLGVLVVRALTGGLGARVTIGIALLGIAIATGYGASDEFHQWFVPGRTADAADLLADAIGGAIGAFVCWLWGILLPAPSRVEGTPRHGL